MIWTVCTQTHFTLKLLIIKFTFLFLNVVHPQLYGSHVYIFSLLVCWKTCAAHRRRSKIYWPSRMICKSCFPKGLAHCIKLELKYCFRLKFCIPFIEKIKNFAYFAKKKLKFRIFALQFSKCILAKNVKFRIFRKSFLSTET